MYYDKFMELCDKKGVKPGTVARMTGIPTATTTAWKQGKYTPKQDKLQKIADYFGVSLEYFTNDDSEEGFYLDSETKVIAQEIFDNSELRLLFDAAKDASPDDLKTVHTMLLALKKKEGGSIE